MENMYYEVLNTKEIYGLTTVNCGKVVKINNMTDPTVPTRPLIIEVLEPEKHNPNAKIICYYLWDTDTLNKIEITVFKLLDTNEFGSEIYYFRGKKESKHHCSRVYTLNNWGKIPKKYKALIRYLSLAFKEVYGV